MSEYSDEQYARCEERRRASDLIYRVCLDPNTSEIDQIISEFRVKMIAKTKNSKFKLSNLVLRMTKLAIDTKDRHMKQALFFWYIYTDEEFAKGLIDPKDPKVPPATFKRFYNDPKNLQALCNDLLSTRINCLREFVKQVRGCYFAQR